MEPGRSFGGNDEGDRHYLGLGDLDAAAGVAETADYFKKHLHSEGKIPLFSTFRDIPRGESVLCKHYASGRESLAHEFACAS